MPEQREAIVRIWSPQADFRWRMDRYGKRTLQQRWLGMPTDDEPNGVDEWRDVPTVEE